jgi:predicted nucleotide-binding protein (sugar kinase/HSP70/actin superfamily)
MQKRFYAFTLQFMKGLIGLKLTFPHMGNAYISVKAMLDTLGIDYYMPPVACRQTLEYGIENSPEFMCLPFKTVIGDMIQGLENGADTVLFGGGCGQCRLSYYGDLMQEILHNKGYKFNYIHLTLNKLTYSEMINKLSPLLNGRSKRIIIKAVTNAAVTVFAVDKLYSTSCKIRCREIKKGTTDHIMKDFEKEVQTIHGYQNIKHAIRRAKKKLAGIETDKTAKPLKVALIGEIFISSEPFTNLEIEKKLGNIGVEVTNTMSVSGWIRDHFVNSLKPIKRKSKALKAAYEYMHTDDIGGHGIYTIGNAELCSKGEYDGIVHIYPFTCMPEIIAQTTFNAIQEKNGVPIMTLILDEMTGEAGYITRLEAFADMIKMRKEQSNSPISLKTAG